jgi:zinc D-Ala-D-Ala dipeptidase
VSDFTPLDESYWIAKEDEIVPLLVDLAEYGLRTEHDCFIQGWTDDTRVLVRRGLADALIIAKAALPAGLNFRVIDGWRPWAVQQAVAGDALNKIQAAHPDWSAEETQKELWTLAPPARIVPRLASHRYGGAVDLTLCGPDGADLEMGVPLNYVAGPEAALLHYEFRDDGQLSGRERAGRANRRMLLKAMEQAGFEPYLPEYWHWGYSRDMM